MILDSEGLGFEDIVKTTIYLTDLNDFSKMNEVYAEMLEGNKPARSTVEVSGLPLNAKIEIDCVAFLK